MRRPVRTALVAGALLWLSTATTAGCSPDSGTCHESDPCPVVDEEAAPGDLIFAVSPGSLIGFTGGGQSTQETSGGEIVTSAPRCAPPPSFECSVTLKRLRLGVVAFTVDYGGAAHGVTQVDDTVVFLEAPIELTSTDGGFNFSFPSDTVDTCATIGGRSWHSSSALDPQSTSLYFGGPGSSSVTFTGPLPAVFRVDDGKCTQFTTSMTFVAYASLTGDGGASLDGADASPLDGASAEDHDAPD